MIAVPGSRASAAITTSARSISPHPIPDGRSAHPTRRDRKPSQCGRRPPSRGRPDPRHTNGFRFLHADRTEYGKTKPPDPYVSKAAATAFRALCRNGFKQFEARAAVDTIVDRIEPDTPIEEVCRMAFAATTRLLSQQHVSRLREQPAVYLPARAAA